jgi:hypothetical protein
MAAGVRLADAFIALSIKDPMKKRKKTRPNTPALNMYQERMSIILRAQRFARIVPTPKLITNAATTNAIRDIGKKLGIGNCGLGGAILGANNATSETKTNKSPMNISIRPNNYKPTLPGLSDACSINSL